MNMKKTYKYQLPQNKEVKSTDVRVENGEILVDVEFKEKFEPKDGDFLCTEDGRVFIYNGKQSIFGGDITLGAYVGQDCCGEFEKCSTECLWSFKNKSHYATEQEKDDFLERLEKEYHKRWNAETKQLEDVRWKPEEEENYWFIDYDGGVIGKTFENTFYDRIRVRAKNCFRTKEAALPYAEQIKEILKNSKAE